MKKCLSSLLVVGLTVFSGFAELAQAADYPSRPVMVVNPFIPGGIIDLSQRPVTMRMGEILKTNFVSQPQPGAAGILGTSKFLQVKKDGYSILVCSETFLVTNTFLRKVRFTMDDFVPLYSYTGNNMSLSVKKGDSRFDTLDEFIAYAKEHPGQLSLGQTGMLGTNHVASALLMSECGVDVKLIPFDGVVATLAALASGHIDAAISEIQYNPGVTALAMFSEHSDDFPEVKTFVELGYPDVKWGSNFVFWAPKGTPQECLDILEKTIAEAVQAPECVETLKNMGMNRVYYNSKELTALLAERQAIVAELVAKGLLVPEK